MTDTRFGRRDPNERGYYGEYGGRFVPETLVAPVEELRQAYFEARQDPAFLREFDRLLAHYVGRPTPVYEVERLRTLAPTKSTTRLAKRCWRNAWGRLA
jgi:tryptophan synthase beta chain